MNARRQGNTFALALIAFALLAVRPVAAFDLVAPFVDPLQTLPPMIESGALLPGDGDPAPCPVSKDFSSPLVLAEAVDLALCNNPQIKSTWAAIKVQAGALGEARAAYLPTLSVTTNRLRTHTTYPGSNFVSTTTNGQTIYGTLAWRLFDFGGREANRESANSLLLAAIAKHDAALQKTLTAVVQSYFDAQTAWASVQAKEQNEVTARSTFESARRREARGVISHGDTLQASTALAKASLEKSRAMGDYRKTLAVLLNALGTPTQTHVILFDEMREQGYSAARNLDEWLEIAGNMHPSIFAARAQWASAKQKITATRSEGLPTVDFTNTYDQNGYPGQGLSSTESRVNTIGISVTIPLFDGFSRTYKIRGAEALAEQRAAELADTEHSILMEVVKTHADATASLQNLQASEDLLGVAQESLNASKRRYDKGVADILEILTTQTALSDAQQEHIRSQAEWRAARLRLLTSVGLMGRSALVP